MFRTVKFATYVLHLECYFFLEIGINLVIPHLLFQRDRKDSTEKHNDFIKVPLKKKKAVAQIGEGGANSCSLSMFYRKSGHEDAD